MDVCRTCKSCANINLRGVGVCVCCAQFFIVQDMFIFSTISTPLETLSGFFDFWYIVMD